ncbi:hypothetical protein F5Y10DRAFT_9932 [Nemania abortiva]|nr:hypothetical protein F5Y10DRAFT_9932 [Nemania abortiva]
MNRLPGVRGLLAWASTLSSLAAGAAVSVTSQHPPQCSVLPTDPGWPSSAAWNKLNATVGGRLIAINPMAHVCHPPDFDEAACDALRAPDILPRFDLGISRLHINVTQWDNATIYIGKPAEIMNGYYQHQSCDPFAFLDKPCELDNYAVYSINVTGADDVVAGLDFAARQNVRLVVHNTGHDYTGKSTGRGSLSLWTHNLKTMEIIQRYNGSTYSGPAIKLGAGVNAGDAIVYVSNAGYRIVTGECGTVGLSGGYGQGGGHGPLNSAYGLASDGVLEWELVTGEGKHIVATPSNQYSDIYWALSGGGGGTYGVVLSMTTQIHPDGIVTSPLLSFTSPTVNNATYWKAIQAWFKYLPTVVKNSNHTILFNIWNNNFGAIYVLPDVDASVVNSTLAPILAELDKIGQPYNVSLPATFPNFADWYDTNFGPIPYGQDTPNNILMSRIVPEAIVNDPVANAKLSDAYQLITETGEFMFGCSSSDVSKTRGADNAVLPAWRTSIFTCLVNAYWNFTAPFEQNLEVKARLVNNYSVAWDAATPGGGVYLNEHDPWYKPWKENLFGVNYDRLLSIKNANDPNHLFYGHHGVGSDEYYIDNKGRLCFSG